MNYIDCLKKMKYIPSGKIYKDIFKQIVLVVKRNKEIYVAKVSSYDDDVNKSSMRTEVEALKFFTYELPLVFFPKYIDYLECDETKIVIMEHIPGEVLFDLWEKKLNKLFWKSLLYQLILVVYIMESNKILHNDFIDTNIIISPAKSSFSVEYDNKTYDVPFAGFIVKIIDFQYMNQYTRDPMISSYYVNSRKKEFANDKRALGWSSKFHVGGDLNQILGILTRYNSMPVKIRDSINLLVENNTRGKYFSTIDYENKKTSGDYLLKNFNTLFDFS